MEPYKTMYLTLSNAVTDAVEEMESKHFDLALYTLERAQKQTEELFVQNRGPNR
ncbi:MAG: hypothetical protein AB7E30_01715 [Lawsonibacter sp.]